MVTADDDYPHLMDCIMNGSSDTDACDCGLRLVYGWLWLSWSLCFDVCFDFFP